MSVAESVRYLEVSHFHNIIPTAVSLPYIYMGQYKRILLYICCLEDIDCSNYQMRFKDDKPLLYAQVM